MKLIIRFLLVFLLVSCEKLPEFELNYIEVLVVDENNLLLEGAKLSLYASETDFQIDRNPLESKEWISNSDGSIFLANMTQNKLKRYWISVVADDKNNWDSPKVLDLIVNPKRLVVVVKPSLSNYLTGRYEKRWKQLHQTINGQKLEDCSKKNEIVFRRDYTMDVYNSAVCSNGALLRNDLWEAGTVTNQLVLGNPKNPTSQKRITILELSESKFLYYYSLKSSNSSIPDVTVVEEFVPANE